MTMSAAAQSEAPRTNGQQPLDEIVVRATMIELIPRVTGCRLRDSTLQGDSGEIRGSLDCPR